MLFFFQAEDGIRDTSVTGVQTCALPILTEKEQKKLNLSANKSAEDILKRNYGRGNELNLAFIALVRAAGFKARAVLLMRSEERRVGKECRYRVAAESEGKRRDSVGNCVR